MTNSISTRPNFTQEQREAWNNAKALLKTLIDKRDTTRVRALHIAMSELRSQHKTRRGPIEAMAKNHDKLIQRRELDRQERLRDRIEEWKTYFSDPGSRKLYIIVKNDLSPSQKVVQASHAAAQFEKENPLAPWINGTMILLEQDPRYKPHLGRTPDYPNDFQILVDGFNPLGRHMTIWKEPDMDDAITAVAMVNEFSNASIGKITGLKLL